MFIPILMYGLVSAGWQSWAAGTTMAVAAGTAYGVYSYNCECTRRGKPERRIPTCPYDVYRKYRRLSTEK